MYESEMLMAIGIFLLVYLLIMALGVATYVMTSLSLFRLGNRRGIKNAWLAWLPIGNYWVIGKLADDYDKQKGMKRRWAATLLTLMLIFVVAFVAIYVVLIVSLIGLATGMDSGVTPDMTMIVTLIVAYVALILVMIVAMAMEMLGVICIYKIFESTVPEKSLKYMLLYMLVPLAGPICLMKCKDKGYPFPPEPVEEVEEAETVEVIEEMAEVVEENNFEEE